MRTKELKAKQTLKWFIENRWGVGYARAECEKLINYLLGAEEVSTVASKKSSRFKVWCPLAKISNVRLKVRGLYPKKYPEGAVVHFTAGHPDQKGVDAIAYAKKTGYSYFFIDSSGQIFQNTPLSHWGSHAGGYSNRKSYWLSKWDKKGWKGVSKNLVGIEIACAGKLNNGKTYFGLTIPKDQQRSIPTDRDNIQAGTYQKFTSKQEESLVALLLWLQQNNPSIFKIENVLGHDEVSGPRGIGWHRKNDPGGSLSMTMSQLRQKLKTMT